MSEETKQEEVKDEVNKPDDNKEESNVVSIFLYFAGVIGMIAIFLLSMAISNEYIDEPAIILLIGIVSAFISGMPIIGLGKIVDLLSEIKKEYEIILWVSEMTPIFCLYNYIISHMMWHNIIIQRNLVGCVRITISQNISQIYHKLTNN